MARKPRTPQAPKDDTSGSGSREVKPLERTSTDEISGGTSSLVRGDRQRQIASTGTQTSEESEDNERCQIIVTAICVLLVVIGLAVLAAATFVLLLRTGPLWTGSSTSSPSSSEATEVVSRMTELSTELPTPVPTVAPTGHSEVTTASAEISSMPTEFSSESTEFSSEVSTEFSVVSTEFTSESTDETSDSGELTSMVSGFTTESSDLTTESNDLTTESNDLTTGFNDLTTGFNDLTTEFNDLTTEFNDLTTGFNDLTTGSTDIGSTVAECNDLDRTICLKANASCVIRLGMPHCICPDPTKVFHKGLCAYPCEYYAPKYCPAGVCVRNACFKDVFSYAKSLFDEFNGDLDASRNLSCRHVIDTVCRSKVEPPFCAHPDKVNASYREFACQMNANSAGFRPISPSEQLACVTDPLCGFLMRLYPCLGGYVANGTARCAKSCNETSYFFQGYCVARSKMCRRSFEALTKTLEGNSLGYTYRSEDFAKLASAGILRRNVERIPTLKNILYPTLVSYAWLLSHMPPNLSYNAITQNASEFNSTLNDDDGYRLRLVNLYPNQSNLIDELVNRSNEHSPSDLLAEDPVLELAYLVGLFECTALAECPPLEATAATNSIDKLYLLVSQAAPLCSTARALFSSLNVVSDDWYRDLASRYRSDFRYAIVGFPYNPATLAALSRRVEAVVRGVGQLNDSLFEFGETLCNETMYIHDPNSDSITVPMTLLDALGYNESEFAQPGSIASFALVLANLPSIWRGVCGGDAAAPGMVPSLHCEITMYLAFVAFMPERPNRHESSVIWSNDRDVVYFFLRAVMREQLLNGNRASPFRRERERTTVADLRLATADFIGQCLRPSS